MRIVCTAAAAMITAGAGGFVTAPVAHAAPYQCGWAFTTLLGVPEVDPPDINVRGRVECDVPPLEHHLQLFVTFRPLGSQSWETHAIGETDSQIPAPWANYGGTAACYAGTWHSLVTISGTSAAGIPFDFYDVSDNIDVPESQCARRP
ncbi:MULTISPECIES: hypothetical protein [unclassified Nocardia]|uniref:hypothetical protein n=1 Tax=unclassified Nocardia TaxID=2637762 RepID=UPI00278BC2AF|nr:MULTISPECIES: hypothetical protein [unclassified Nocardia]